MTPYHWLLCLSLSTLLTACTTAMTPPLPALHNSWLDPEVTTKIDIARQYGQPADVLYDADDSTWLYYSIISHPNARSLIPFVGFFVAGSTIEIQQLALHFTGPTYHEATHDQISQTLSMYAGLTEKPPLFLTERQHVADEMARLQRAWDAETWTTATRGLRVWQMLRE